MVGIWLDNKNNPPAANPFGNGRAIAGGPAYINGYGILAAYNAWTVINSGAVTSPSVGIGPQAGGFVSNQSGGAISGTSDGINIQNGGGVTNLSGGTIGGGSRAVLILNAAAPSRTRPARRSSGDLKASIWKPAAG